MYEKIELIISEYKLNRITKEKCLIELRNHIEQIIKQVDTKQLTLNDVSKSFTAKQVADMLVKDFATIEQAIFYFDTIK